MAKVNLHPKNDVFWDCKGIIYFSVSQMINSDKYYQLDNLNSNPGKASNFDQS